ncbi:hypothetical protein KDA_75450 [Dictyobacter alpinus]|uniref:Helix-turn-helix domain-containing protein n=1 Tax=Dictyobacter alpinus TaxID=2014873 RepID=A0A402BL41_9CHLR|nr:hypothetical protein [Dictyobacter alpinus]GCE32061.1 hypothetical protein KDA_75450 [Dictyobacter alpinus]
MEPSEPMDDQYINAVKASELLRIGYKTMLRWIKAGRIQAIERRYDYDNAEFLIPLQEIERLRATLSMSQRELLTRFLKLELDAQGLASRLLHAEGQIFSLQSDLAQLHMLVFSHLGEPFEAVTQEGQQPETGTGAKRHQPEPTYPADRSLAEPPPGSARLTAFLREHGVATTTGLDHLVKAQIEPLLLDRGAKDKSRERWLTAEMQGRLVVFWDSASKRYVPCFDCPHYQATTEAPEDQEDQEDHKDNEDSQP